MIIVTKKGIINRINESELKVGNRSTQGLLAIKLSEGDTVIDAMNDQAIVRVIVSNGKIVSFPIEQIRETKRGSQGVRAVVLPEGDYVVGLIK